MKSKIFNTNMKLAFDASKNALKDYKCEAIYSDFKIGTLEAQKSGNFLSKGEKIIVEIKANDKEHTVITVSTSSDGLKVLDWGENKLHEAELLELIAERLTS